MPSFLPRSRISRHDEKSGQEKDDGTVDWKATWKRFGPLMGLACILLDLISLFGSLVVLTVSNNQQIDHWNFEPSTYIAIATAVGNQALRFAAVQGMIIITEL